MTLLLLSGCVQIIVGNGVTTVEDRSVEAFSAITAEGSIPVFVVGGASPAVRVSCDENLQRYILVQVEGDTLVISEQGANGQWVELRPEGNCEIDVTAAELQGVTLSGSSPVSVADGEKSPLSGIDRAEVSGSGTLDVQSGQAVDDLQLEVSGSGAILLDNLAVTSLRVEISGSGTVAAAGSAQASRVEVPGSGNVSTRNVVATEVDADISGSGHAEVTATERFSANISGSGSIDVWGDPTERDESISGSGSVEYY